MKARAELYTGTSTNVRITDVVRQFKRLSIHTMGLVFPQKTQSFIKQTFFKPVRKPLTTNERQWIDSAEKFQIRVHGKTVQCWQWGQGPKILAVHGWNGLGANLFPYFNPLLQEGYSVVAFDAPAHGNSEGEQTNYFEMTDTVRAMVHRIGKKALIGIVAHSLGGAAVINCLSKENIQPRAVLIAPALRLKELLVNTFKNNGVPKYLFNPIIGEMEDEYGYSLDQDNPYRLLEHLDSEVMIAHDRLDRVVPFADTISIARQRGNIVLHATTGLGHKRIIHDRNTVDVVLQHLTGPVSRNKSHLLQEISV